MNVETIAAAEVDGGQIGLNEPAIRILVADDQAANIQIIGNVLGKFGYEIVPASDGPIS